MATARSLPLSILDLAIIGKGQTAADAFANSVALAQRAEARRLVLFHHDPDRSDDGVDRLVERARVLWGDDSGDAPVAAAEGMTLDISSQLRASR